MYINPTDAEHQKRHLILHKAVDELAADYIDHHPDQTLSTTTLMDLLLWSGRQIVMPEDLSERSSDATGRY